jgi:hypothetical protein
LRIQLRILSGQRAGEIELIRRFPCLIGRSAEADVCLEEPGVWDWHLELQIAPDEGITAAVLPGALAAINGEPFDCNVLRNGDLIDLGAAKVQFWLSPTRQRRFWLRECLTWMALGALGAAQIALIYQLLR